MIETPDQMRAAIRMMNVLILVDQGTTGLHAMPAASRGHGSVARSDRPQKDHERHAYLHAARE
jgi:hypothetical protein